MKMPIINAINKDLGLACTEEGQVNLQPDHSYDCSNTVLKILRLYLLSVCMHNLQLLLFIS